MKTPTVKVLFAVVAAVVLASEAPALQPEKTYTWTGGVNVKWSEARNWSPSGVPGSGDLAILPLAEEADVTRSITIDRAATVGAIQIDAQDKNGALALTVSAQLVICSGGLDIPGRTTIQMDYPVSVTGDVTVASGAKITHMSGVKYNSVARINLTVDGALSIAEGGAIDATGLANGNGGGSGAVYLADPMPHGGSGSKSPPCYGSVLHPINFGSNAQFTSGGGAIRLTVSGDVTVNGAIAADARMTDATKNVSASGGSVWIDCRQLKGTGRVTADANAHAAEAGYCSSGGRIALYQRGASDLSGFKDGQMHAYSTRNKGGVAFGNVMAGTVYLVYEGQADDEGTLVIDNGGTGATGYVELSAALEGTNLGAIDIKEGCAVRLLAAEALSVRRGITCAGTFTCMDDACALNLVSEEDAYFSGTLRFPHVTCEVPGKKLTFASGESDSFTVSAGGSVRIVGVEGSNVELTGAEGAQAKFVLEAGVDQYFAYNTVNNMNAAGAEVISYASEGANNTNWTFAEFINPGETVTWTDATGDANWFNAQNWSPARVPISTDIVKIPAGKGVTLGSSMPIGGLVLEGDATFALGDGMTLTVAGDVSFGEEASYAGENATIVIVPDSEKARNVGFAGHGVGFLTIDGTAGDVTFTNAFAAKVFRICGASAARNVYFAADTTFNVGFLYANGAIADAAGLTFASTEENTAWHLAVAHLGVVGGVTAVDSDARGGKTILADALSSGLRTHNWTFGGKYAEWTGSASSSFTDGRNWTGGSAPDASTAAVVVNAIVESSSASEVGALLFDRVQYKQTAKDLLTVRGDFQTFGTCSLTLLGTIAVSNDLFFGTGAKIVSPHEGSARNLPGIHLVVGKDFVLEEGATIWPGRKYGGPGQGGYISTPASYGGRNTGEAKCYGSLTKPTEGGSQQNNWYGGGIFRLEAEGRATIDGDISAEGCDSTGATPGGSGGSIWITCGTLAGAGTIYADGGRGCGGRVALYETAATDFSAFTGAARAWSGLNATAPGTVYWKTAAQADDEGTLVIADKPGAVTNAVTRVEISEGVTDCTVGTVIVSNGCTLAIAAGQPLTVKGDFLVDGAFVCEDGGELVLAGSSDAHLRGDLSFSKLTCAGVSKRLYFDTNTTSSVTVRAGGVLTFVGASRHEPLVLASEDADAMWKLTLEEGTAQQVKFVTVDNSDARGGQTIHAKKSSGHRKRNPNWDIPASGFYISIQ